MPLGWRLVPDFGDAPVWADQKSGPHNSQKRFAQKLLHPPSAISFDGLEPRIAQQREIQIVFRSEFRLSFHCVAAAAKDDRAQFIELRFGVTKLGRFGRSTRSQRLREKIKHHGFAAKPGKCDLLPIGCGQPKIGSFVACLEHFFSLLSFGAAASAVMPEAASKSR